MKKLFVIAAASSALFGQTLSEGPRNFQFAVASGESRPVFTYSTIGPLVTGRPYSATEERHTSQTLGDGTHIESAETNRVFRDEQGRTRVERKDGTISIHDPVEGFSVELDPATKTARKMMIRIKAAFAPRIAEGNKVRVVEKGLTQSETFERRAEDEQAAVTITTAAGLGEGVGGAVFGYTAANTYTATNASGAGPTILRVNPGNNGSVENLAPQMVNGILAQGTRTTESIPVGKIGNDRAISIVSERWFSDVLQLLIKSSSSDPRFGTTTYQLTNVVQNAPDPSLFQIPPEYTVRK